MTIPSGGRVSIVFLGTPANEDSPRKGTFEAQALGTSPEEGETVPVSTVFQPLLGAKMGPEYPPVIRAGVASAAWALLAPGAELGQRGTPPQLLPRRARQKRR